MIEIPTADTARRVHRATFRKDDSGRRFDPEEFKENGLLGVVRARRIAGCRADAPVAFTDEILIAEIFSFAVAAKFTRAFVKQFGRGFSETIAKRLNHDGRVVVGLRAKLRGKLFDAVPRRNSKPPHL